MPKDVFISYSAQDKKIAQKICAILEKKGVNCWIAPRDVKPVPAFAEQIIEAIEACKATVLILSKHSNDSTHVRNEVSIAFKNKKPIFPLRIQNVKPSKQLEYYISTCHWTDAFTPLRSSKIQALGDFIKGKINEPPKRKTCKVLAISLLSAAIVLAVVYFLYRTQCGENAPDSRKSALNQQEMSENQGGPAVLQKPASVNIQGEAKPDLKSGTSEYSEPYTSEGKFQPKNEIGKFRPAASSIAILHFEKRGETVQGVRDDWWIPDLIQAKLSRSPVASVAERSKIEKVIDEQKLQMTGLVDPKTTVSLGKLIGVKRIVMGEYRNTVPNLLDISIQLVDVEKGQIEKQWVQADVKRDEIDVFATRIVKEIEAVIRFEASVQAIVQLHNPRKPFGINILGGEKFLKIGDIYNFSLKPDIDCYLTVLDIGTSGKITVLFPNRIQPDNFVKANGVLEMPKLRVKPPAGLEKVKIIATKENIPLMDMAKWENGGASFVGIPGDETEAFSKDLEVIVTPLDKDNWTETTMQIQIVE